MISGHLAPTTGRIRYKAQDITRLSVVRRARLGIGRKFQTPSLFDNSRRARMSSSAVLRAGTPRRRIAEVLERVRLDAESRTPAKHLSHGQRQWLEIALLLANAAELVLLDEPTAGMTAEETHATGALIRARGRARPLDHRHRARHQLHPRSGGTRHGAPPRPRPDPGLV